MHKRSRGITLETASAQSAHQQASDPAQRFLELLQAAVSSGRAHIADRNGHSPDESPEAWGWRSKVIGAGEHERQPLGKGIGYVVGDDLYLIPDAAYSVAKRMGSETSEGVTPTPVSLYKRLNEAKSLISTDKSRETLKIRRMLESKLQDVLHLSATAIARREPGNYDAPPSKMDATS